MSLPVDHRAPRRRALRRAAWPREILLELGRRKMVGGQEDMIEDAALTMARERKLIRGEA